MKKAIAVVFLIILIVLSIRLIGADKRGRLITQGPRDSKSIALTFDDGPASNTDEILAILDEYGIKATFFLYGEHVELRKDEAYQIFQKGHEIGSHLYSHPNFYKYKEEDKEDFLIREIRKTEKVIFEATGMKTKILRMPHGCVKNWIREIAAREGYVLINWTFGCDWLDEEPDIMQAKYISKIGSGEIFLFHDGGDDRKKTLIILRGIIDEIIKRGYKIVTVGELLATELEEGKED